MDFPNPDGPADGARESRVRNLQVVIVFAVALCVYANTLPNGFVLDDHHQVLDNPWVTSPNYLRDVFSSSVWEFEARVSSYYRPFMYVLYLATYLIFGLKPWAFHLVNVVLHGFVTAVLFLLVRRMWKESQPPGPWFLAPPFIAAVLFAAHPVHTEAVAWVAGVADVSSSLFYLLALFLYVRSGTSSRLNGVAAAASFLVAMLCKEPAVTLPILLLAYELLFRRQTRSWRAIVLRLAPFGLAVLLYLGLRTWALGGPAPTASPVGLGSAGYALSVLALFSRYVQTLVLPVNLNVWHVFSPATSLFSADAIVAITITGICIGGLFVARTHRMVLLASALTVIPLLPTFYFPGLTQGIENAFTERYLYLPSAGFVIIVAAAGDWCRRRIPAGTPIVAVGLAVLLIAYSIGTVHRNSAWRDSYSLWSDAVKKSPDSAVTRLNHGYALLSHQRLDEGRAEMREALRLRPTLLDDMLAKGIFYSQKGLTKQAILQFHFALAAKPDFAPAHFNLGVLYESKGWIDQAISEYAAAIAIQPDFADAHNNLGILYAEKGLKEKAVAHLEAAARLRPADSAFAANLKRAHLLP